HALHPFLNNANWSAIEVVVGAIVLAIGVQLLSRYLPRLVGPFLQRQMSRFRNFISAFIAARQRKQTRETVTGGLVAPPPKKKTPGVAPETASAPPEV